MTQVSSEQPPYLDSSRPVCERVEDLLGRMTLDEKLAQLGSRWVFELTSPDGGLSADGHDALRNGLGQVTRISGATSLDARAAAEVANLIQRRLVEETRLGIPAIVHEEICSGLMAPQATVFPQAIGLASTWEPELVDAIASTIRTQMRASGAHQGLGPLLDVCRDPRWGRLEETFGEDPHLVARMGVAFVRGLQGDDLRSGVVATAKHFAGYGGSEGGRNWAPAQIPPRELRDVYLHPFEAVVREGRVRSVMNAYNEIDGVPCVVDHTLLTELLRDEWGFDGCVVSDYFAIRQLADYHRYAVDAQDAAAKTLEAGVDVELPSSDCYAEPLAQAVTDGIVSQETLDRAVRRVLQTKFELGLFEQPFVDAEAAAGTRGTAAHRTLARAVAHKSVVLLRNDGVLPLRAGLQRVAVIGPSADDARNLFGDYAYPAHVESLRDMLSVGEQPFSERPRGLVELAPPAVEAPSIFAELRALVDGEVLYARGCEVEGDSRDGFDEAVALARESDVAILVVGDKSGLTEDCTSGESRDRASLDLPGVQGDLVAAVAETGTPVVLVLVAGRPYGSAATHERCAAVLHAWLPGEEGAAAIAEILTGEAEPGGRLPISYPRSSGQLPVFYGHKISGGRSHWRGDYADEPVAPLYPFGHGLGYTTFALSDACVRMSEVPWDEAIVVDVTVANTGERAGEEVVQLYVRDLQASVTRPVLELKSFVRVEAEPGASRRVTLAVPVGQLGFAGRDLAHVVEPGAVEALVGTSAANLVSAGEVTVVATGGPPLKVFDGWTEIA